MGQYHHPVNMTAREYLHPHEIGNGLKAWECMGGGIPAAMAALIAHKPGNGPADLGWHPMIGRWAGHRLLVVGDYAENKDIRKFDGPPLGKLYHLCSEPPKPDEFKDGLTVIGYGPDGKQKSGTAFRAFRTAEWQYKKALASWNKYYGRDAKKYGLLTNVTRQMYGAIEGGASVRFCGERFGEAGGHMVAVKPFAERGKDGHLHYVLTSAYPKRGEPNGMDALTITFRMLGLGGWGNVHGRSDPIPDVTELPPGMERWPWDRPPADLSWHNLPEGEVDAGQHRVFANLDKREFFDPAELGEVPTLAGIMRAVANSEAATKPRMAMDTVISAGPRGLTVDNNVRTGSLEFGSAAALYAMLLHPDTRGGGDINPEDFPLIGEWRNNRIVLTSEYGGDGLPSTSEVKESFANHSKDVLTCLVKLGAS